MATKPFKYYLHDDLEQFELLEFIADRCGLSADDPVLEKIGRPFYEITLDCELDLDTGDVRILGATQ